MFNKEIIIKDNIIYHDDVICYFFKIDPFSNVDSDDIQLSGSSALLKKMLQEINMPGGILSIPKVFDRINGSKWLDLEFDKYGNIEFRNLKEKYKTGLLEKNDKALSNVYYIYFCDGRKELNPKEKSKIGTGIKDFFTYRTSADVNDMIEMAKSYTKIIYEQLANHYNLIQIIDVEQTTKLYNIIDFPLLNEVSYNSKYEFPKATWFESIYINDVDGVEKTIYSKYSTINMGEVSQVEIKGLGALLNSNVPTFMHIKWDFDHPDDFIQDVEQKKEKIEDDNRNFRKHNRRTDHSSKKVERNAKVLFGVAVENDIDFVIRFQIYFRVSSLDMNLTTRMNNVLLNNLKKLHFNVDTLVGRQELAHFNFKPYTNSMTSNAFVTTIDYFTNLNPLGSSRCGSVEGYPLFKNYKKENAILFNPKLVRRGLTKNASTTFLALGGTGSGKSMLLWFLSLCCMAFSGYKVIYLYPKGDEVNVGNNQKELKGKIKKYRIGDADNNHRYKGILDPFLVYGHDIQTALSKAKGILKAYSDCNDIAYHEYHVNEIVEQLRDNNEKVTLTNVVLKLKNYDDSKQLADTLEARFLHPLDSFYFGDEKTNQIDLDNFYSFIQLTDIKKITAYNPKDIEHVLTNIMLTYVVDIISNKVSIEARTNNQEYIVVFDEWSKLSKYPVMEDVPELFSKTFRSTGTFFAAVSQNPTDFPPEFFNNVGFSFIGKLDSMKEINYVAEHMKLTPYLREFLIKRLKEVKFEDEKNKRNYPFIFSDYNNNSTIIEAIPFNEEVFKDFDDEKD